MATENKDIIKTVQISGSTITLLGTAHVSKESVVLVEEKIMSGEFDCIAVELCPARYENLVNQSWWKNLNIFEIFKKKKASLLLINLALSAYQKRLADKVGIEAGKEMIRATELAREKNIRLEVIDRDISTTLHRLVTEVSFWQKIKIFSGLVVGIFVGEDVDHEQIESLKKGDMLHSVIEEFGESLPEIKRVLIDERDEFMTGKLALLAASKNAPKNILAMVGAGHLIGMEPAFKNPAGQSRIDELSIKPPSSRVGYFIGWAICAFILGMFYVGYQQSPELGWSLVMTWVVINGGLSALGAALAFAHPLSVLTAFLAAPLTSLNPTIGAGVVVGLVESYLRKPKVTDFERLREDIASFPMWWKNGVVRVLLVFFFANVGSAVGTYVAGASIVQQILG
ncbi:MAG TPA: TraB/GumN family protein [Nitrospinaceae bacterium]|nr:TraB/GumN family protein [Nitrospinaceae bacterium]MDP7147078.1 TraB/GumN family protein [Nitrospinaceae bacterium]HJO58182.1 TraB/GumN family protein [Nitrospinaceae bacterium]